MSSERLRIAVIGAFYSDNLGDGVICRCVAELLKRQFPEAEIEIRDIRGRTEYPVLHVRMEGLAKARRRQMLREAAAKAHLIDKIRVSEQSRFSEFEKRAEAMFAKPCDIAVFAGGQLFMDRYAVFVEKAVASLAAQNCRIYFNAVGLGPSLSASLRHRLSAALNNPCVRWISLRDGAEQFEKRYHPSLRAETVSDPALWTDEVYHVKKADHREVIGLGVIYPGSSVSPEKEKKAWLKLFRFLDGAGVKWTLFTNGGYSDYAYAQSVLASYEGRGSLLPQPKNDAELVRQIAGLRGMISYRLHSHIIAASLGIPAVALVWDEKLVSFYRMMGCPERCLSCTCSPEEIWRAYCRAEQEGMDRTRLKEMRQDAEKKLIQALKGDR